MSTIPAVNIVGFSNSGKTTLIEALIRIFKQKGLRIASIKHDIHGIEMDTPGKDTWKHRDAGAAVTMILAKNKWIRWEEREQDFGLQEAFSSLEDVDLVFVEGFKKEKLKKLVILRGPEDACLLDSLTNIVGVITWFPTSTEWQLPCFSVNDIMGITAFIEQEWKLEDLYE